MANAFNRFRPPSRFWPKVWWLGAVMAVMCGGAFLIWGLTLLAGADHQAPWPFLLLGLLVVVVGWIALGVVRRAFVSGGPK